MFALSPFPSLIHYLLFFALSAFSLQHLLIDSLKRPSQLMSNLDTVTLNHVLSYSYFSESLLCAAEQRHQSSCIGRKNIGVRPAMSWKGSVWSILNVFSAIMTVFKIWRSYELRNTQIITRVITAGTILTVPFLSLLSELILGPCCILSSPILPWAHLLCFCTLSPNI